MQGTASSTLSLASSLHLSSSAACKGSEHAGELAGTMPRDNFTWSQAGKQFDICQAPAPRRCKFASPPDNFVPYHGDRSYV